MKSSLKQKTNGVKSIKNILKNLSLVKMRLCKISSIFYIQNNGSLFVAKIKGNQKALLSLAKEIEEVSFIDSDFSDEVKSSNRAKYLCV